MDPKYFPLPQTDKLSVFIQKENQSHFYDILHFHSAFQITYIVSGTGTIFAGDGFTNFEPGDIFVIGENIPHVFRSDGIYYEANKLKSVATTIFFTKNLIENCIRNLPEGSNLFTYISVFQKCLKLKDLNLISCLEQIEKSTGYKQIVALLFFLSEIPEHKNLEYISSGNISKHPKEITFERINKVFDYVMTHYQESIKLEEIARLINMTPNAFCKYFKQRTRKTFIDFLNDIRINQACILLKNAEQSITDIAYSCGFNNISNFNRQFIKRFQVSPGAFRNKMLNQLI